MFKTKQILKMSYWIPGFIEIVRKHKNSFQDKTINESLKKFKVGDLVQLQIQNYEQNNSIPPFSDNRSDLFSITDNKTYKVICVGKTNNDDDFYEINVMPENKSSYNARPYHCIITDGTIRYCENGLISGLIKEVKIIEQNITSNKYFYLDIYNFILAHPHYFYIIFDLIIFLVLCMFFLII